MDVLAPLLTRRWLSAVLSGAPQQRRDDIVRLRVTRALDPAVAAVPWALTRLPLGASLVAVASLRAASLGAYRLAHVRRPSAPPGDAPGAAPAGDGAAGAAGGAARRLARAGKRRMYSHSERRDDWLRAESAAFLQATLLAEPVGDVLLEPGATARLLRAHLAGADHSMLLGQLLNLRLWQRLFEEQDAALRYQVRRGLGRSTDGLSSDRRRARRLTLRARRTVSRCRQREPRQPCRPRGGARAGRSDMAGYDRSGQEDEPRQGDADDIGGTGDVGDSSDVDDTRSMFDDELQPARFDLADSIDEDDLSHGRPGVGNRVEMTSLYSAGYRGRTYIFDTQECRDTFLASPEVYIAAA